MRLFADGPAGARPFRRDRNRAVARFNLPQPAARDDAEGRFVRDALEAAARAKTDEARIELGTQIDAFRKIMGRFPTHLDTHHHVGRLAPILELVLDFGLNPQISPAPTEPVKLTHRVVMNFFTAKRLLLALNNVVVQHENAYGALELDFQKRIRTTPRPGGGALPPR